MNSFGTLCEYFLDTFGKVFGIFFVYFWVLFWIHLGHVCNMFWILFGYFLDTFWIFLGYFWFTFWIVLEFFWNSFGILFEYFFDTFGNTSPLLFFYFSADFLLLIHWLILLFRIFKTMSIPNRKSWGAEILRECSPPTMLHVGCQVSGVRCKVSGVKSQIEFVWVMGLVGRGSVIHGANPSIYFLDFLVFFF